MRNIFPNEEWQAEFDKKGYVIVPGFLSREDVDHLSRVYDQYSINDRSGFHASSHINSYNYRNIINQEIGNIFETNARNLLTNYRACFAAFTVKEPGYESAVPNHLDWSMVDEDKHISLTIWCPLTDITAENGQLWVLEGSHKMGKTIRGGPEYYIYSEKPFSELQRNLYKQVGLPVKAGDAVIYDHRLFHGSSANLSNDTRLAINQTMLPSEVPSTHYYLKDHHTIEVFEVDDDFYLRYEMGTMPTGVKHVETLTIQPNFLSMKEIDQLIAHEPAAE